MKKNIPVFNTQRIIEENQVNSRHKRAFSGHTTSINTIPFKENVNTATVTRPEDLEYFIQLYLKQGVDDKNNNLKGEFLIYYYFPPFIITIYFYLLN